ncbi:bifunctional diaminohydroxyphosphoribosylaminopyrimidine deaminase/5-amino-6-(5-phosphoribosylamino)uracil reductase RibD [Ideonella sp. TBM-1]|uniref:Riboflavin biosynthesis protein RibD n=2 Tax=Ideonella livida TaxID=2707176 RepID=A0A7C9PHK1_9BURK|nr:bifunctional diaminohydroxyphosphoribosylaminopyrimidine deaminase/5-amino-6-(5-phosphoribosylamino)uracil reductase RibD [Ideonella livida]
MALALSLAEQAIGLTDPNPRVGCVLVSADGRWILGQGHTQPPGQAHAEVMALRDAQSRGHDVRGATAYVTLEPCAHHGRTPPCCDALAAAGVGKVVAAALDPNPQVNGQGMARLQAAGICTEWSQAHATAARELNIGFFQRMALGRPWVRLKAASSADGQAALGNGRSQWITQEPARRDGHAWRRRAGVVLTGIGTARHDNPRLDVRLVPTARQPRRALVDARLELPLEAALLDGPDALIVYHANSAPADRARTLQARGAELVALPADTTGRLIPADVLADLAGRQFNEIHLEAGPALNGAWLAAGLVDEILLYLAPALLGAGLPWARLGPWETLEEALRWQWHEHTAVGADLRLRLRPSPPAHRADSSPASA